MGKKIKKIIKTFCYSILPIMTSQAEVLQNLLPSRKELEWVGSCSLGPKIPVLWLSRGNGISHCQASFHFQECSPSDPALQPKVSNHTSVSGHRPGPWAAALSLALTGSLTHKLAGLLDPYIKQHVLISAAVIPGEGAGDTGRSAGKG